VELGAILNVINTIVEVHAPKGLDLLAQVIMVKVILKTNTLDSICTTMFITKNFKHEKMASMVLG